MPRPSSEAFGGIKATRAALFKNTASGANTSRRPVSLSGRGSTSGVMPATCNASTPNTRIASLLLPCNGPSLRP